MTNDNQTKNLEPDNFILDQDIEITLLNILNRIKRNEKIQTQLLETQLKNQETFTSILKLQDNQLKQLQESQLTQQLTQKTQLSIQEIQLSIQQILSKSLELQSSILNKQDLILEQQKLTTKELQADADMGEYLTQSGTVTTTDYTVINTILDPGFPVKGYEIENTGNNDIYFAHNYIPSSVGADIADVTGQNTRFSIILAGKSKERSYNRREINNVYLLAKAGNSTYIVTLIW